jgi:hypothetical protein
VYEVRAYLEGVRLTCEELLEVLERGLKRLVEDLGEAVDRIPYTITSRQLVEGSLKLSQGLYNIVKHARTECRDRQEEASKLH